MSLEQNWPGERLGLPQTSTGSLAKFPRRLGALALDWAIAYLISYAFFRADATAIQAVFLIEQWLLVATTGASIGHRLFGMRVIRLDGAWIGFWRSLIRAGLLVLLIPAVIWDADNRGLHDKAAGTALVLR
ncbi:MAG: RDD family protein [Micrococcales bacterium]